MSKVKVIIVAEVDRPEGWSEEDVLAAIGHTLPEIYRPSDSDGAWLRAAILDEEALSAFSTALAVGLDVDPDMVEAMGYTSEAFDRAHDASVALFVKEA